MKGGVEFWTGWQGKARDGMGWDGVGGESGGVEGCEATHAQKTFSCSLISVRFTCLYTVIVYSLTLWRMCGISLQGLDVMVNGLERRKHR